MLSLPGSSLAQTHRNTESETESAGAQLQKSCCGQSSDQDDSSDDYHIMTFIAISNVSSQPSQLSWCASSLPGIIITWKVEDT